MNNSARRHFLRRAGAASLMGTSGAWLANMAAMQHASAQSTSTTDYRALVCLYMAGGNDAHNTVLATDEVNWLCYSATRDPAVMASQTGITPPANMVSIALPQSSLLKITPKNTAGLNTGRTFALHPQLKKVQSLFTSGKAAVVANVGPLLAPVTKAQFQAMPETQLPKGLFSHNDQTSTWQSFGPEGSTGGWGGLLMDKLASRNTNSAFSAIGVNANSVWLNGTTVAPYMLGSSAFQTLGGTSGQAFGSVAVYNAVRQAASTSTRTDDLVADYLRVAQRTLSSEAALSQSLPPIGQAPWGTAGVSQTSDPLLMYTEPSDGKTYLNPLAVQLQAVARMMSARSGSLIGAKRQVFMVQMGGFDTHSAQMAAHASLMAKVDHAISYFQTCLASMPSGDMTSQVTTFTASEFGRALINNGDGCDHGWGGHQFVIGGGVKGGDIYGQFPIFGAFDLSDATFFGNQMIDGSGALLPSIGLDQFVYTLGKWLGVSTTDLEGGMLPNIANFSASTRDLGFMSA